MADWEIALLVNEPLPVMPTPSERTQCMEVLTTLRMFGGAEMMWLAAIQLLRMGFPGLLWLLKFPMVSHSCKVMVAKTLKRARACLQ